MDLDAVKTNGETRLSFHGGNWGAILPFFIFLTGVVTIALSGAPDERGFWPILVLALGVALILSKDRTKFSNAVIDGMSERIVMIMITAWMLASIIGILMTITGFVEALIWVSEVLRLGGTGFVIASLIICCTVSLSTGSSFATILICTPLLYPAGGLLGSPLPVLAGAILAGATFGDFVAPISDTTIASALSQKAEIGPTVRSRLRYIAPVTVFAILMFLLFSWNSTQVINSDVPQKLGSPKGLPMLLVPILIIFLFLRGKHLLHGLMFGLLFGTMLGLCLGLLQKEQILSLDLDNFVARSFVIDGINRAVGISFFTILLMGLVASIKGSGLVDELIGLANKHSRSERASEGWIAGVVAVAVLLTTHSIVAILMVSEFANRTGKKFEIGPVRRSNILSLVVCVFPFILPYFIPVILMANMTGTGSDLGIPSVSPLQVGLYNFISWGLLVVVFLVVLFGFGRKSDNHIMTGLKHATDEVVQM